MRHAWLCASRSGSVLWGTCNTKLAADIDVRVILVRSLPLLASMARDAPLSTPRELPWPLSNSCDPVVADAVSRIVATTHSRGCNDAVVHPKIDLEVCFADEALRRAVESMNINALDMFLAPTVQCNETFSGGLWEELVQDCLPHVMSRPAVLQFLMRGVRGVASHSRDSPSTIDDIRMVETVGVESLSEAARRRYVVELKAFVVVVHQGLRALSLLRLYREAPSPVPHFGMTLRTGEHTSKPLFSLSMLHDRYDWDALVQQVTTTPNQKWNPAHSMSENLNILIALRREKNVGNWLKYFGLASQRKAMLADLIALYDAHAVDGPWEGERSMELCKAQLNSWLYSMAKSV